MNINMNDQLFDEVFNNNLLNVQQLVLNGADVNSRNRIGNTPLHLVRSVEIAQFLVLNGADVNSRDEFDNTPLHYTKSKKIVQYLVENGVNINCQNKYEYTPLHYQYQSLKYAKILLDNGADMHIKNNVGMSAYDLVIQSNNNEIIELFEQYNAISNGLDIKEPCVE